MKSRTQRARDLMAQGMTAYAAAKKVGINPSNIYHARKRKPARCPHCGEVLDTRSGK